MFVDEAAIRVKAGDGGNGAVSFRREKYVPRGGPDGGDGGRGGNVIAVVDPHLRTLIDFTYRSHFHAENGGHGGGNHRRGKKGRDLLIPLPPGVVIKHAENGEVVGELLRPGDRLLLARGGRGGKGNARFASSTRQAPRFGEKGEPGDEVHLILELKLLADVGVIGLPNAGKSSLIARVSAARPKIAEYPFTTLVPNLGVVKLEEGTSFVIADLPGLIEGAHAGAGRGHAFLRHAERTRLFIHLLDPTRPEADPVADLETVNRELLLYDPLLAQRPQLVALNKMDLNPPEEELARAQERLSDQGYEVFRISAVTGAGVEALIGRAARLLDVLATEEAVEMTRTPQARPAKPAKKPPEARVEALTTGFFAVSGEKVERAVVMTDLKNEEALRHLQRRLEAMGVIRKLRELGAKDGDRVKIGDVELEFRD